MKRLVIKEASKDVIIIDPEKLLSIIQYPIQNFLCVRSTGNFKKAGFYLVNNYNWDLGKDSDGFTVLVPTKK